MYKPILVTGASSGIGEATAVHLAQKGFRVYAGARNVDKLKSVEAYGEGRIIAIALDVTDDHSVKAAMQRIADDGVTLYGVVNNAGVSITGPAEEVPISEWRRQFETNVFGLMRVTQAALPQMRKARAGRIVNIGSLAGRIVSPFMGVYASSKHAVEGLSDALRRELKPFGVFVSVIRPGFINTPFGHQEQQGFEPYLREEDPYSRYVAVFKQWHSKGHPNGAAPLEVAEAVHDAITSEHPQSRYVVPRKYLGALTMRNTLPTPMADRIFERVIGLNRVDY